MIKGIILDVDGVIVGGRRGFNTPLPHPDVSRALKTLHANGVVVSLCTGRGTFAIKDIVESAHLDNLHIGDGGAVVMDFLHNSIIDTHVIPPDLALQVIKIYQQSKIYLELYSVEDYYIQKNSACDITVKHAEILGREPVQVASLSDKAASLQLVKIMPIAKDEPEKQRIISSFGRFKDSLSLQWGVHPMALPIQFGLITAQNISKKHAAGMISQNTGIPFNKILGIGDSITDWDFMCLCGYAAAMGNASADLKKLVSSRSKDTGFIGPGVDENGILEIFSQYNLKYK
jgi:HAD superfamily hydrolase (TIGR01484 family)